MNITSLITSLLVVFISGIVLTTIFNIAKSLKDYNDALSIMLDDLVHSASEIELMVTKSSIRTKPGLDSQDISFAIEEEIKNIKTSIRNLRLKSYGIGRWLFWNRKKVGSALCDLQSSVIFNFRMAPHIDLTGFTQKIADLGIKAQQDGIKTRFDWFQ